MNPSSGERHVIVHYHIFKNAGTSIDACLQRSFGSGWRSYEKAVDGVWNATANVTTLELRQYVQSHPDVEAVSSHTVRWPEPSGEGLLAHPIVFLRQPIDRIYSIFSYRRRLGGAEAESRTFSEYVDWIIGPQGNIAGQSFQTMFLSDDACLVNDGGPQTRVTAEHYRQALRRVRQLPVVGIVDRFELSIQLLQQWLRPRFPRLHLLALRENASETSEPPLADRLAAIVAALGKARYRRLAEANEADMELYAEATRSLQRWASPGP